MAKLLRRIFEKHWLYVFFIAGADNLSGLNTVMIVSFWTDMSRQTVQTQIRLLLEEQSDQGLQCLQFNKHLFDKIPLSLTFYFEF